MRLTLNALLVACLLLTSRVGSRTSLCPGDMVPATPAVCIDRYEWPNVRGAKPLIGASGVAERRDVLDGKILDAERLCASVGKRVCTSHEWISACEGPDNTKYPFGDSLPDFSYGADDGVCNYDKWALKFDEERVFRRARQEMERLNQSEPSGARTSCVTATGAYDMMGNVEEWVTCPDSSYGWCLMGRYWSDPMPCSRFVSNHAPNWHWFTTGFRCCKDMENSK